jgi:hypothetical protein
MAICTLAIPLESLADPVTVVVPLTVAAFAGAEIATVGVGDDEPLFLCFDGAADAEPETASIPSNRVIAIARRLTGPPPPPRWLYARWPYPFIRSNRASGFRSTISNWRVVAVRPRRSSAAGRARYIGHMDH